MKRALLAVVAVVVLSSGCYVAVAPDGSLAVGVQPTLAYIPGTGIQTVASAPDVFFYDGYYWRCNNGMWYRSSYWNSGWVAYRSVPNAFLSIPHTHPAYNYVKYHPQYRPGTVVRPSPTPVKRVVPSSPSQRVSPSSSPKKVVPSKDAKKVVR